MKENFQLKYLELEWYDKDTLLKVTESMNSLRLEYNEWLEKFEAETTIYPKSEGIQCHHLAFRLLNQQNDRPYIMLPDGKRKYLREIHDKNTGKSWWIVAEEWCVDRKQWIGLAPNVAGTLSVMICSTQCDVYIGGSDFSRLQLEQYLTTFKNDLWELILDENSDIHSHLREGQGVNINQEVIDSIQNIVHHAEKILITPKVELREIQRVKPRKSVKPVNRTFMELVTKTNHRLLTSRDTEPSYNVSENRYVLFALERCHRIMKHIVMLAQNKTNRYKDNISKLRKQHDSLTHTIEVNRDLVIKDLNLLEEKTNLEYWQNQIDNSLDKTGLKIDNLSSSHILYLRIEQNTTEQYTGDKNGFFIKVWDSYKSEWVKPNNKTGVLPLYNQLTPFLDSFHNGMDLAIDCHYSWQETNKSVRFFLKKIQSIKILWSSVVEGIRAKFNQEQQRCQYLEQHNWTRALTSDELETQNQEKSAINNRIKFYSENQKMSSYVYEHIEPKLRKIQKIINGLKQLKIKSSSYFPNSMTFIQNPHYQSVHNSYKVLRDASNLADDELLISLEEIDDIGLVNMPLIYERWCLIQIIQVLKESFRFTPQEDWKYKLLEAIKTDKTDIKIELSNESAKRFFTITYEKTLENGKRPDFVLDLRWFEQSDAYSEYELHRRYVMDAKFYDKSTFTRYGGMLGVLNSLRIEKNYSENNQNPVFIIHPCHNLIDSPRSAQSWAKYSFLGETDFNDDGEFDNHNLGAIFLNPIERHLFKDELQRLFGLFIQYKLEKQETESYFNDETLSVPICIRCGSTNLEKQIKQKNYLDKRTNQWKERTSRSVYFRCNECLQFQVHNHCANSKENRPRLIKNGLYWSYHSARALEPFNMKCPCCGQWGIW